MTKLFAIDREHEAAALLFYVEVYHGIFGQHDFLKVMLLSASAK